MQANQTIIGEKRELIGCEWTFSEYYDRMEAERKMKKRTKNIGFVLWNVLLGVIGTYVMIYCIFGFYGFMSPPKTIDQIRAAFLMLGYLVLWIVGNAMLIRGRIVRDQILLWLCSLLIISPVLIFVLRWMTR